MKTYITIPQIKEILTDTLPGFSQKTVRLYGVPRGGVPVSIIAGQIYENRGHWVAFVKDPSEADVILDDIIDSGETRNRVMNQSSPRQPIFRAVVDKTNPDNHRDEWIVFPWEETDEKKDITDHVLRVRQFYGRFLGALKVLIS